MITEVTFFFVTYPKSKFLFDRLWLDVIDWRELPLVGEVELKTETENFKKI